MRSLPPIVESSVIATGDVASSSELLETLVRATIIDVLEPEWAAIEASEPDGMLERPAAFP